MIAITTVGVFFLLLVLVYPTICAAITLYAVSRKRAARKSDNSIESLDNIDHYADLLKKRAFVLSLVITFFIVAPFLALILVHGAV